MRSARARALATDGLRVTTLDGQQIVQAVETVRASDRDSHWDVAVLAVKATALQDAMEDIGAAVGTTALILPVLNGIDHIDVLTARFGRDRVLGGVAAVATEVTNTGVIVQRAPGASLMFGELDGSITDRVLRIAAAFAAAEFDSSTSETIVPAMWEKWFLMTAGGAATTLLGGNVGEINAAPDGTVVVGGLIDEIAALHAAAGHPVPPATLDRFVKLLTQSGSGFTTSLYRDYAAGRPTEVEPILGSALRRARTLDIAAPLLGAATVNLRVSENRRSTVATSA